MSDLETLERTRPAPRPSVVKKPEAPESNARPEAAARDVGGGLRRMRALIRKEMLQILRDPSSLVVAVVLPLLLLFLFGFGVSFDVTNMRIGVVIENPNPETEMFEASLANTPFFQVRVAHDRRAFLDDLTASRIEGVIILAGDFTQRISRGDTAGVQIITDGTDPNTASLVNGYVQGAWQTWLSQRALSSGLQAKPLISTEPRVWFNPELESRRFLVPGSIALILMMIRISPDRARGRPRMGARHHRGAAGDACERARISCRQGRPELLPRHGGDGYFRLLRRVRVRHSAARLDL